MSSDQSLSAHRGPFRDAVTWMALGLVVAAILVFTTHHSGAATSADHSPPMATTIPSTLPHRSATSIENRGSRDTPGTTTTVAQTAIPDTTITNGAVLGTTQYNASSGQSNEPASTTTTTATTHVVDLTTGGQLNYPDDIASTYLVSTSGGQVSAQLTWHTGATLALELRCSGESLQKASSVGLIQLVLATPVTRCVATVTESSDAVATALYTLFLRYPSNTSNS